MSVNQVISSILSEFGYELGLYRLGREVGGADYHPAIRCIDETALVVHDRYRETAIHMDDFDPDRFQSAEGWHSDLSVNTWNELLEFHVAVGGEANIPLAASTDLSQKGLTLAWGYEEGLIPTQEIEKFVDGVKGSRSGDAIAVVLGEVMPKFHLE